MASTSGVVEKSPSSPRDPFQSETNFPPRFQQDEKLIHGFELQQHVSRIFESKDLTPLQEEIEEYARTKKRNFTHNLHIFLTFLP
ncbi:hypothetical protein P8452_20910 [Trifolium repens]|nr:hypothetical protein P8452_20910 [Trifolium repens]